MSDEDEDRMGRPDGHRYDAPESDETRVSKEWVYGLLGLLVDGAPQGGLASFESRQEELPLFWTDTPLSGVGSTVFTPATQGDWKRFVDVQDPAFGDPSRRRIASHASSSVSRPARSSSSAGSPTSPSASSPAPSSAPASASPSSRATRPRSSSSPRSAAPSCA